MRYGVNKFKQFFNLDLDGEGGFGTADGGARPRPVTEVIGFNEVKTFDGDPSTTAVHCFLDDYQFERIWQNPQRWAETLKEFAWVVSPDFSYFRDVPFQIGLYNSWRARVIATFFESEGVQVIPALVFAEGWSSWAVFSGYTPGGYFAVSTIGVEDAKGLEMFQKGVESAASELAPDGLVIFGDPGAVPPLDGVDKIIIKRKKGGKGHKWEAVEAL